MPGQTTDTNTTSTATEDAPAPSTAETNPALSTGEGDANTVDAQLRSAFSQLTGREASATDEDSGAEPEAATEPGAPDGVDAAERAPGSSATGEATGDGDADADGQAERLAKAEQAISRQKLPDELRDTIQTLPVDRRIEIGEEYARRQAELDALGSERARFRQMLDDLQNEQHQGSDTTATVPGSEAGPSKDSASAEEGGGNASEGETAVSLGPAVTEALGAFKDNAYYEELAGPLETLTTAILNQVGNPPTTDPTTSEPYQKLTKALDEERRYADNLAAMVDRLYFADARRDLVGDLPMIKEQENFERAYAKARSLSNLPVYRKPDGSLDVHKVLADATRTTFGKEIDALRDQQLIRRHKEQTDGVTTGDTVEKPPASAPVTVDDELRQKYRELTDAA